MPRKRLVLLVEGEGDKVAAFNLVRKLIRERQAWDVIDLDIEPIKLGGIECITGDRSHTFLNRVGLARKRQNFGAALIILDGDARKVFEHEAGQPKRIVDFCHVSVAKMLAARARQLGAGAIFTVAVAFARQEFESWFISGCSSLAGKTFDDGQPILPIGLTCPFPNTDIAPRDAKGWLKENIPGGYRPTERQGELALKVDFDHIRARETRSFQHLESALDQIIATLRASQSISIPT
jgi:hypothetical protein